MDALEKKTAEFIRTHGLFAEARRILLAVSGGADSTALLYVLTTLRAKGLIKAELVCAHINHRLRGTAGDRDEQFVVEQAAQLDLPAVVRAVDVQAYAEEHKLSVETAGRQLRLANLGEIAKDHSCSWIATGHQKNDNAETVLQRLRRGTGYRGLAGIWPARRFGGGPEFASPLLCVTRDEIVRYLKARALTWREDHTNVDSAYTRNFVRHKLLPVLQQGSHRSVVEELSALATSARKLHHRVRKEADEAWTRLTERSPDQVIIDAGGLGSLPEPVGVELIRLALVKLGCGERDVTRHHYLGILQLARQRAGGKMLALPGRFTARREHEKIILALPIEANHCRWAKAQPTALHIPGRTQFAEYQIEARVVERAEIETAKIASDKDRFVEYLDDDRVRRPLVVRARRTGDRFRPLGVTGEKKVGKFLTTAKVPRVLRERVLMFDDGEKIVWVCPVRVSEQTRVTDVTRRILLLKVKMA